jgi:ATP-dependent RNA helicase DOB1
MSGRAGRRGKDDRGIVIQMLDEKMEPAVCKGILYGEPDPLNSSYRISYNMLLNMMRVEDVDPEYLLRASFHQFQKEKDVPRLLEQANDYEKEAESIDLGPSDEVELVSQYYHMDQQLLVTQRKMKEFVRRPEYVLKFLQTPGRFIHVVIDGECYGWGALLSCKKKQGTGTGGSAGRLAEQTSAPQYTLEVLLFCVDRHFDSVEGKERNEDIEERSVLWQGNSRMCRPVQVGVDEEKNVVSMRVFTIGLESIDRISAVRIFIPKNHPSEVRKDVALSVKEVQKRFPDGIPLLDPVKDLGIKDQDFTTLLARAEALKKRLVEHRLAKDLTEEDRIARVQAFEKRAELLAGAKAIKEQARSFETVTMKEDLKKMKRVLKRLGHVDANGVIQTKGRTACEINTANELVVVELIFTGAFNDLSVEQCCSLLSCMTYDERNKDDDDPAKGLKSYLANPFYKLQEIARTVAEASVACKIELDEEQFIEQFNPGM